MVLVVEQVLVVSFSVKLRFKENLSVAIKFVCLFVVVVIALGVFALDFHRWR